MNGCHMRFRSNNLSRLADNIEPAMVVAAAVIQRAVLDATSRPTTHPPLTPAMIAGARQWIASDDFLVWASIITPSTRDVADVAADIRRKVGIGSRPEQAMLTLT